MYLDDGEFSNKAIHFTSPELERYRKLGEITESCSPVNHLIIQTAQEILLLSGSNEYLIAKIEKNTKEIVLPFTGCREYIDPITLEEILKSEEAYNYKETHENEVELDDSTLSALNDIKKLYLDVMSKEGPNIETVDSTTEIFEIGFNYLEALVSLTKEGYSIRILDNKRNLTNRGLKLDPVLMKVKTEIDVAKRNEAELNKYTREMEEALKDFGRIKITPKTINYEEKLIKERRKR